MKKKQLYFLIALLWISFNSQAQRVFYVDHDYGNDTNNGMKPKTAWKSLERINTFIFQSGDKVLLKRGQEYKGMIHLKIDEKDNLQFELGAFGTGRRPIINAAGNECAIKLLDSENFKITDIETVAGNKAGIFIGCTKDELELNNIRIENCYVHDIGDTTKLDWDYSNSTGGIIVFNGNLNSQGKHPTFNSVFNDVIIDGCTVRYNSRWNCISISSGKKDDIAGNSNIIRNCIAEFSVADGIRMNGVKNSRIEYCVMYRNGSWPKIGGRNLGGLGAWFFNAENCTIQYCEASYVGANTTDGGAFDIDYWQKNSTVQYCYGHHCAGYGVSIFGADPAFPTENSVVRYNILCNNGQDSSFVYEGDFFIYTWSGGFLNGVKVHDNLSIWDPVVPGVSLKFDVNFTGKQPNTFTNNIIYSTQSFLASIKNDSLIFGNNTYWVAPSVNPGEQSEPLWTKKNTQYHSLKGWENVAGIDANTKYEELAIEIPNWYKATLQGKHLNIKYKTNRLLPGMIAPNISGKTIKGQQVILNYGVKSMTLLSFININNLNSKNYSIVRSQLAFLKSMKRQYEGKGLKVVLVVESQQSDNKMITNDEIKNFITDELENVPLLIENSKAKIASKYGVETTPTSFLISENRIIAGKWENLALPAEIAFCIENELKK